MKTANGSKCRGTWRLVLQRIPPRFVVDETNRLRERADTNLNPQLPAELRGKRRRFFESDLQRL